MHWSFQLDVDFVNRNMLILTNKQILLPQNVCRDIQLANCGKAMYRERECKMTEMKRKKVKER